MALVLELGLVYGQELVCFGTWLNVQSSLLNNFLYVVTLCLPIFERAPFPVIKIIFSFGLGVFDGLCQ